MSEAQAREERERRSLAARDDTNDSCYREGQKRYFEHLEKLDKLGDLDATSRMLAASGGTIVGDCQTTDCGGIVWDLTRPGIRGCYCVKCGAAPAPKPLPMQDLQQLLAKVNSWFSGVCTTPGCRGVYWKLFGGGGCFACSNRK